MKNDDVIVGGQPQVALDPRAEFERRRKGKKAVFRKARTGMQAAMREALRTGVERVRA